MISPKTRLLTLRLLAQAQSLAHNRSAMLSRQSVLSSTTLHPGIKAARLEAKRLGEAIAEIESMARRMSSTRAASPPRWCCC